MDCSKLCRICLLQHQKIRPIMESIVPVSDAQSLVVKDVWVMFAEILAVFEEEISNEICDGCFDEIQRTYLFVQKCEDSISYLRKSMHKKEDELVKRNDEIKVESAENNIAVGVDEPKVLWSMVVTPKNEEMMKDSDYSRTQHETNAALVKAEPCNENLQSTQTQALIETKSFSEEPQTIEIVNVQNTHTELIEFEESQEVLKCTNVAIPNGEYAFQCSFCLEIFTNKDNLNDHMKVHSLEFPFDCEFCSTKFRSKEYLNVHLRCHSRKSILKCHGCSNRYRSEKRRSLHMLQRHPDLVSKMEEQNPTAKRAKPKKTTQSAPPKNNCRKELKKSTATKTTASKQSDKSLITSKTSDIDESDGKTKLQTEILSINEKQQQTVEAMIQDDNIELGNVKSNDERNSCNTISDDIAESLDIDPEFIDVEKIDNEELLEERNTQLLQELNKLQSVESNLKRALLRKKMSSRF